jgi:hypothetical protein
VFQTFVYPKGAIVSPHEERFNQAEAYLRSRTGTYAWRCVRYNKVYDLMRWMRLTNDDLIIDVGAGYGDFDFFLRYEKHFTGRYLPVDAALDGTNLNTWKPRVKASFIVSLETLEHLKNPHRMMRLMRDWSLKGCVATTPNADVVDVLAMDVTHVSPLSWLDFADLGWQSYASQCFGSQNDSLIGYLNKGEQWHSAKKQKEFCCK